MEAAFFDLDKTIIATSSVIAHTAVRCIAKDSSRSARCARHLRATRIHGRRRRRREDGTHARSDADPHEGWDHEARQEIVLETLDEVITPVIYAERVELIEEQARGPQDRDHLLVTDRDRRGDR
jgi:hypothetical protein